MIVKHICTSCCFSFFWSFATSFLRDMFTLYDVRWMLENIVLCASDVFCDNELLTSLSNDSVFTHMSKDNLTFFNKIIQKHVTPESLIKEFVVNHQKDERLQDVMGTFPFMKSLSFSHLLYSSQNYKVIEMIKQLPPDSFTPYLYNNASLTTIIDTKDKVQFSLYCSIHSLPDTMKEVYNECAPNPSRVEDAEWCFEQGCKFGCTCVNDELHSLIQPLRPTAMHFQLAKECNNTEFIYKMIHLASLNFDKVWIKNNRIIDFDYTLKLKWLPEFLESYIAYDSNACFDQIFNPFNMNVCRVLYDVLVNVLQRDVIRSTFAKRFKHLDACMQLLKQEQHKMIIEIFQHQEWSNVIQTLCSSHDGTTIIQDVKTTYKHLYSILKQAHPEL